MQKIYILCNTDYFLCCRQSFGGALSSIQNVLEFIENEVLKECAVTFSDLEVSQKLRQIIQTLDGDISKMQISRREAKYEIVISHYNPVWFKAFAETMEGLSKNLYGFSLAVEREGQVIERQKLIDQLAATKKEAQGGAESDADIIENTTVRFRRNNTIENDPTDDMKRAEYLAMAATNKMKRKGGTVPKIEYKLISRLQSSVQPEMKKFIQICTNVMRCIRHRLQESGAIPKGKKQDPSTNICSKQSHEHALIEAMESLKQAKIILQREYEERRSVPTEDHFLIYTVLFSLTQFGKKLVELELETDELVKKRAGGRFPCIFFPRVNLRKWLEEANDSAKGERNAAEQVIFDHQSMSITTSDDARRSSSESDTDEEEGRKRPTNNQMLNAANNRLSVESDWVDDDEKPIIPLQHAPGSHRWNKWLYNFSNWVKTDPFRYAMKFSVTMTLLALMAWLPIEGVNALFNVSHNYLSIYFVSFIHHSF